MHYDLQYLNIAERILKTGIWKNNRTQYRSKMIPSASITWDLRDGFPVLTTKKVYYKQAIGEILGFLRGASTVDEFKTLGCKWWESDANENKVWLKSPYRKGEGDLGKVYGVTWRKRDVYKTAKADNVPLRSYLNDIGYIAIGKTNDESEIIFKRVDDQLAECCRKIVEEPNNRRNIFHAWFPELFDEMCLPPCHCFYEFVTDPENKVLHMTMTQRSTDYLLGAPMNLFGSALVLAIVASATGYTPGVFTHSMTDVHFYENQLEAINIQIKRKTYQPPVIYITPNAVGQDPVAYIESLESDDIVISNYKNQGPLPRVDMAQEK